MNFKNKITTVLLGLLLTTFSFAQTSKPKEYLGVSEQISFDNTSYHLVWTSHPADNYYKQEYIVKGDTVEKFKSLIMLEIITGKTKLKEVVATKIAELKKMKASNPVVNYEIFEKNGEVMLDFLVSENTPDGKYLSIVERNVYRYKSVVDKNGQKGILLFGVSERAYGDDIDNFFPNLKAHRLDLISLVGEFEIPEITVAK
jgi:hypothetical protein